MEIIPIPARAFRDDEPVVGTFFFYWYDYPSKAHFINPDGTENELHEGTDICETREYGRGYIELTRHYVEMFRYPVSCFSLYTARPLSDP